MRYVWNQADDSLNGDQVACHKEHKSVCECGIMYLVMKGMLSKVWKESLHYETLPCLKDTAIIGRADTMKQYYGNCWIQIAWSLTQS